MSQGLQVVSGENCTREFDILGFHKVFSKPICGIDSLQFSLFGSPVPPPGIEPTVELHRLAGPLEERSTD